MADALRVTRRDRGGAGSGARKTLFTSDLKPENVLMVPDPETLIGRAGQGAGLGIAEVMGAGNGQVLKNDDRRDHRYRRPICRRRQQCRGISQTS